MSTLAELIQSKADELCLTYDECLKQVFTLAYLKDYAYGIGLSRIDVRQYGSLSKKASYEQAISVFELKQLNDDEYEEYEVEEDDEEEDLIELTPEERERYEAECEKQEQWIDQVTGLKRNQDSEQSSDFDGLEQDIPTDEEIIEEITEEENEEIKHGDTVQHHLSDRVFKVVDIIPDNNGFIGVVSKITTGSNIYRFHPSSLKKIDSPLVEKHQSEHIYNWNEVMANNMVYPTLEMLYREVILTRNTKLVKEGRNGTYRQLKIRYGKDFIVWRIINILREYSRDDVPKLKEVFEEVLNKIRETKEDEI